MSRLAISNELLYTGRRRDPETGLQLNRNRFYASHLGRWVNRDPIGYNGSKWNLFEYVNGMPTIATDPKGYAKRCVKCTCRKKGQPWVTKEISTKCNITNGEKPIDCCGGSVCGLSWSARGAEYSDIPLCKVHPSDCAAEAAELAALTSCCAGGVVCTLLCGPACAISAAHCAECIQKCTATAKKCCPKIPGAYKRYQDCLLNSIRRIHMGIWL